MFNVYHPDLDTDSMRAAVHAAERLPGRIAVMCR